MRIRTLALVSGIALLAVPLPAAETPPSMVAAYESLADTILAVRAAEADLVRALLDGHYQAANTSMKQNDFSQAAAQMALFANEGDNAVGGVRKRLLEGGHHFNAAGEEQGVFEPGYVIVTREAKKTALDASRALRQATSDEGRQRAWREFKSLAESLLQAE